MSAEEETDQERRITFCLYESWEKIAGSSGLPALKRLQRQEIEAFKSNLVLLDLRNGKDNPTFQVIGNGLTEDLEADLIGRPLADVPRRSMLSRVTDHYLEVLANRVPIAFEAEFVNRDNEKALYRGILLPFSDDNRNINFILGGVRWILAKDVKLDEDKPTIEELMRTIAAGRDEITLDNEDETTSIKDELEETTSHETLDSTLQEDEAETAIDKTINLESVPSEEEVISHEKVVWDEAPTEETSTEVPDEESLASDEVLSSTVETNLEDDNNHGLDESTLVEEIVTEDLTTYEEEVALEEYNDIKADHNDASETHSEAMTFDTADSVLQEKAETETTIDNSEAFNLESATTEEKIVFEEPSQNDNTSETTSNETSFLEEISIESETNDNTETEPVAEETYIEIDETTSFEDDIIEELTAKNEQEESQSEALDLTANSVSEESLKKTEEFNTEAEANSSIEENHITETKVAAQEEPPVKEKLEKRKRKGSVIERSMEMLLGKSKKKDIFGHEIRSVESKITLPKQPEFSEEPDIIEEQEEVSIDANETRLITPDDIPELESQESKSDENDVHEEPSITVTEKAETPSETTSISFEDEIDKVLNDPLDETSAEEELLVEDDIQDTLEESEIILKENSNEQPALEEEIILDNIDESNINKSEAEFHETNDLILEEATETAEIHNTIASEEITSFEKIGEISETSSLNIENEIPEEIAEQVDEIIALSLEENAQPNVSLEEDINLEPSIHDKNEEITLDVTEAEDIIDDTVIIEQQVAPSSEPVIPVSGTSHDSAIHKEESSDEQSLHDIQDSLKQIIRYIKKEDASHNRSRDSLYNILTVIYKFHSVCEKSPEAYTELVAENGLKVQERAPFTPVLKICLGKDYDKTRLTEYAAALGIAKHMNVDVDDFHDFIKHFPGGIKGCVKEMRAIRKGSNGANLVQQARTIEEARNILRDMPVIGRIRLKKMIISKDADEFCLLLAKRRGHDIDVLKVLDDQYTKIDPILKRAAFIKGNLKKEK